MLAVEARKRVFAKTKPSAPHAVTFVVPASWGDAPRTATTEAAGLVGLDCRLLSAPLATAVGALLPAAGDSGSTEATKAVVAGLTADEGSEADEGGPTSSAVVLVVVAGQSSVDVGLVQVTSGAASKGGKGGDDPVKHFRAVRTLAARGDAYTVGLVDAKGGGISASVAALKAALTGALAAVADVEASDVCAVLVKGALARQKEFKAEIAAAMEAAGVDAPTVSVADEAAARGATAAAAASRKLKGSFFGTSFVVTDALSKGIAVAEAAPTDGATWAGEGLDVVFPRDTPLPAVVRRTYNRAALRKEGRKNVALTITEEVSSDGGGSSGQFARVLPLGDPLRRVDVELSVEGRVEYEKAKEVTLEFTVNEGGIMSVTTEEFVSVKDPDSRANSIARTVGKILLCLVIAIVVGGSFYSQVQSGMNSYRIEQDKFNARVAALTEFYEEHNPEKIGTIEETLRKHAGKETKLWKSLEAKYGKRPPRPIRTEF